MTTAVAQFLPINILAGVCPSTDASPSSTRHFTDADKIRFVKNRPQKLKGWLSTILNGSTILGTVRSIYSSILANKVYTVFGSNQRLYALIGSDLANITPLDTSSAIAAANSIDTHYDTLGSDPLTTVSGSTEVTVTDADASRYVAGDTITLSGATAVAGIPAAEFNKAQIVRSVGSGSFTIKITTAASSSTSGGGASVVRTSGVITFNKTAHGMATGDRIQINAAVDTGGIAAASINAQHIIRNVQTNSFNVVTDGTATSSVSGGGGASTTYYAQISAGLANQTSGQGYGMGKYGVGLYGTAFVSDGAKRFPRIWFFDSFGDAIVSNPGGQNGVYTWDGDTTSAPTLVSGAPMAVNYAFISDNTLVTLGAGGVGNKVLTSDQGDITQWVASSTNQVFEDNIEGAGTLISHVNVDGTNLLYTSNQCYTLRKIDGPALWEINFKDDIGLIAPMARVVVKGVAYWMGPDNFYMWRGGNVDVMPSNSSKESTLLKYVFENINRAQQGKSFAWYNQRYDEIWFHYPSEGSNEINRVARFHTTDLHWTPDTFDRLAAEYPTINSQYPRLISSANILYRHEVGANDDTNAMAWRLKSNYRDFGTDNVLASGIIPDSVQAGDISFKVDAYSFPQSAAIKNTKTITIAPTTEFTSLDIDGRFLQYTWSGEELNQTWLMGDWLEPVQKGARSQ